MLLFSFILSLKAQNFNSSYPWEKKSIIPVQESHFTLHLNCLYVFIFYGPAVLSSVTLTALNYVEAQACDTSEPTCEKIQNLSFAFSLTQNQILKIIYKKYHQSNEWN